MNIAIFGTQGSGKGTQAKLLAKRLKYLHLDMGKLLREEAKRDKFIDNIVNKEGSFLSHKITISVALKFLDREYKKHSGLVADGFPRFSVQFIAYKKWLEDHGEKVDLGIYLRISDEEAVKRLSSRRICKKCGTIYNLITDPPPANKCKCGGKLFHREDDKPDAIKKRLKWNRGATKELVRMYKKENAFVEVDGGRPIEVIHKDILSKIKGYGKNKSKN